MINVILPLCFLPMTCYRNDFFFWHFGHMEDISDFAFVLSRRCYLYMKEPKGLRSLCCTNLIFQLPLAAQQDNPRLIGLKIILCHLSKFCVLTRLSWRLLSGVSPVIEDRQSWSWGHLEAWLDQISKWLILSLICHLTVKGWLGNFLSFHGTSL